MTIAIRAPRRALARLAAAGAAVLLALPPAAHGAGAAASAPAREAGKTGTAAASRRDANAGFAIGPVPAWVQPLAEDPSVAVEPAPLEVLLNDQQVRIDANGVTRFVHAVRRIDDASGLQQGGQIEIEFDPGYQKLVLHELRIVRDGKRIDKLDPGAVKMLHREKQFERQVIDGRMTAAIVLDDLRVGDRVEWSASIVGENPVFGGRFADTVWSPSPNGPTGLMRYRLLAPAEREIHLHAMDPAVQVTSAVHDGVRETVLSRRGIPRLQVDGTAPAGELLKFQTDLSEFADWREVAVWSRRLFARATAPTPALDAEVASLKAQAATPEAQVRAALDFVQQDIRYFGTEVGPGTQQPADADTVLRQRFGDCKDKVALLTALLARMGFDAAPVLVSAVYGAAVRQREPTPRAFDHAIVRVVLDGQPVYLDATRSHQAGPLAARQARGFDAGLVVQADSTALADLPDNHDVLRSEVVDTFRFDRLAEPGTLESVATLHGDLAEGLRAMLAARPLAEVGHVMAEVLQHAYPGLAMTGEPKIETLADDDAIRLTAHYRTGDFWHFPEQRQLTSRIVLYSLAVPLRIPGQATRTQPLRIALPGRFLHTVRIEYGEPLAMTPSSARVDEDNAQFGLHVRFDGQAQRQEIDGELHLTAEQVSAADWPAYREKLNQFLPRLLGSVSVPSLSPDEVQAERIDAERLMDDFKHGHPKIHTPKEAEAYLRGSYLDKVLAAGRLPPKLRAQALVARGILFDTIARREQAADAFAQALALDPGSAQAHEATAISAFERDDATTALAQADATLKLAPSDTQARYTRAWTHYFADDPADARSELVDILQSRTEVERSYGTIWLYLATRRLGGDAAEAIKPFMPTASRPDWPYPVLQYLDGQLDFDAALAASRDGSQPNAGRECELYFFAGEKAIADADPSRARKYFDKSVATGIVEFQEYGMSQRELARLGPH